MKRVRPAATALAVAALLLCPLAQAQKKPAAAPAKAAVTTYASQARAMAWADEAAQRLHLDPAWVRSVIAQARFLPQVPKLMIPPPRTTGGRNWSAYRARFVEPVRLQAGIRFWEENAASLERAQAIFGVPPEMVLGILGVETLYGRHMGNLRVLDALATLTFDFPPEHPRAQARQAYFASELEQFLLLCQEMGLDPREPRGSYAGAMGLGQFMPSSWRRWAVDFDGDGKVDLFNSVADAIGSVANYFRVHGWEAGMPTHFDLQFEPERLQLATLLAPDIQPTFTASEMAQLGAIPLDAQAWNSGPLALIELPNGDAPTTYVAGTRNFYTVTRYNWSSFYAMAVIELGNTLRARRLQYEAPDSPQ